MNLFRCQQLAASRCRSSRFLRLAQDKLRDPRFDHDLAALNLSNRD
jgi:hypothetical protein